ncbi:MAG: low temperature requirement protein A [Eggerthellaceae bacterium]|nr:low temperature requirement protein A [Eggerthellaceae bacterium]
MNNFERIGNKLYALAAGKKSSRAHQSLSKATLVELFFDLVLVFCIRTIGGVLTDVEGSNIDWYTYYTFCFTFVLLIQIWFNSTVFMNRLGVGGLPDIVFLFTTMFLLIVMTQAISTSWEHYAIYNICWVLITVNMAVHWLIRYRHMAHPTEQMKRDTRMVMVALGIQAILVLASHALPKNPAQIVCLVALLSGFSFWNVGGKDELNEENREHLTERCALLMVIMFGETLINFGAKVGTDLDLFRPIMHFLIIAGMFLIYINEIANLFDTDSLHGGRLYMAISAWLTFCVANLSVGYELATDGFSLMGLGGNAFFCLCIAVYLLSFLLFLPFNKYKHPSKKWIVARIIASLLVFMQTSTVVSAAQSFLTETGFLGVTAETAEIVMMRVMMIVAVIAVYAVVVIDRIALRRAKAKAALEASEECEMAESALTEE